MNLKQAVCFFLGITIVATLDFGAVSTYLKLSMYFVLLSSVAK